MHLNLHFLLRPKEVLAAAHELEPPLPHHGLAPAARPHQQRGALKKEMLKGGRKVAEGKALLPDGLEANAGQRNFQLQAKVLRALLIGG
jgi:hypothetical protein